MKCLLFKELNCIMHLVDYNFKYTQFYHCVFMRDKNNILVRKRQCPTERAKDKYRENSNNNIKYTDDIENINFGALIRDLFNPPKDTYNQTYLPIIQSPLYDYKGNKLEQIKFFLPDTITENEDFLEEKNFYYLLTQESNKNYNPGIIIKKEFEKNRSNTIQAFEKKVINSIIKKDVTVNINNLVRYLLDIKDYILPYNVSPLAFEVFDIYIKRLYKENDNINKLKILAKILSRIALSIILLQWPTEKQPTRAYKPKCNILNKIWIPSNENDKSLLEIRIKSLFQEGQYENAIRICDLNEDLLKENESLRYLYSMILLNKNHFDIKKAISNLILCKNFADAKYALYEIYSGKYDKSYKNETISKTYFQEALNLNCINAIFDKILNITNNILPDFSEIERLLSRIESKIYSEEQFSYFYYYKGIVNKNNGNFDISQYYFKKAYELGHKLAQKELKRENRITDDYVREFSESKTNQICIINSSNLNTMQLLRTLPLDTSVYSIHSTFDNTDITGIKNFNSIKTCFDFLSSNINVNTSKIIVAFFNDDDKTNLNNALELIDRIFNNINNSNDNKSKIIHLFEIFVKSNFEYASMFIDASLSSMGNSAYLKVHIIDPVKTSIDKLIYQKPTFIPCLQNSQKNESNILICSNNTNFSYNSIKEIMAVSYTGPSSKVSISTLSNNILSLKNKLNIEMPGLLCHSDPKQAYHHFSSEKLSNIIETTLIENSFSYDDFFKFISTGNTLYNENNILYKSLSKSNYIIINIGSDEENINFAVNIRKFLSLRCNDYCENSEKQPFIAVYCKNPKTAYLAQRMSTGNRVQGSQWFNKFDLYFFGMSNSIYTYDKLINNSLERQAKMIHLSYYGNESFDALNDYYSFQYNIDSCLISAINLRYRLFSANCYDKTRSANKEFSINEDEKLSLKYDNWLSSMDEEPYSIEQTRWCNFMISRGYQAPSIKQLETYIEMTDLTDHKNQLAKLNPYMFDWDDDNLSDDSEICEIVKEFKKKQGKEFTPPKAETKKNVKSTGKWLSMFKEREQEKQLDAER